NDIQGLPVLIVSILWNYGVGFVLSQGGTRCRIFSLSLGTGGNLLLLGFYKYADFFWESLGRFMPFVAQEYTLPGIHQPLGVSFFTFQAISYLIDLYRNTIKFDRNLFRFGLYLAIFPHLIAGPIIRYGEIAGQLLSCHITVELFARGLRRFIKGLGKKMLLANLFAGVVDRIFSLPVDQLGLSTAWFGAFLYSLQIYYDFSGYTDMAIGIGMLFGFQFPENFNYPYAASSIRDFWRRWHITLSSWFRDYLYIPLGGSRGSTIRTHLNLILVFVLCGLWHGASWNFLIWGGLHGMCMVAERIGLEQLLARGSRLLQHSYVLAVLMASWVLFRMENMSEAFLYLRCMFWPSGSTMLSAYPPGFFMNIELGMAIAVGVMFSFPWWRAITRKGGMGMRWMNGWGLALGGTMAVDGVLILILVAGLMEIAAGGHHPFIYFQF
ncbi:MAG: MBOAT family protein, partial [Proteobacteria bacterium]|nr:MBOAT family protein [Pseudomonadota bacterium]